MLSFCVDCRWCTIVHILMAYLLLALFARFPGSRKKPSTLRTKMDDANWKMFFFFPRCQHVLSRFWRGFPRVGIQGCTTLLIRLFCHVPLHLSWAYCSREWEKGRESERRDEGVGWGTAPPSIPVQPAPDCQAANVKSWALMMANQMWSTWNMEDRPSSWWLCRRQIKRSCTLLKQMQRETVRGVLQ